MSKIIKAHSLTGRITDGLMLASFKAVKRNRGAAGIDKVSIKMFEANPCRQSPSVAAGSQVRLLSPSPAETCAHSQK